MYIAKPTHEMLTLLLYFTLVLVLSCEVEGSHAPRHGDHVNLKRLIRKRAPFPQESDTLVPVVGAGAAVPSFPLSLASSASSGSVSASSASATSASSSASDSLSASSASSTESSSSGLSSESSASSTSESTTSASTTSVPPVATSETLNLSPAPNPVATTPPPKSTVTQTTSLIPSATPSNVAAVQSNTAKTKSTTVTVLIVVASAIAAVAILWTVFRKWKLRRSSKFDERLNPIDWQPTTADDDLPGLRRTNSGSTLRSGNGHAANDRGLGPLPEHDFTAGSSTLASVGGYADLARGPSPQPPMHEIHHDFAGQRGYNTSIPLHHQAGYADYDGARRY